MEENSNKETDQQLPEQQLILLRQEDGRILTARTEGGRIAALRISDQSGSKSAYSIGNIYLGKVQNIVKNIKAAFIELEPGITGFLPLQEEETHLTANVKHRNRLCIGDLVVVQVAKEPVKSKPVTLTGHLRLTGKYIVLLGDEKIIQISQKIENPEDRLRLKNLMEQLCGGENTPGFIVRTNARDAQPCQLEREASLLIQKFQAIMDYGIHREQFSLLYRNLPSFLADIRDSRIDALGRIVTDDPQIHAEIEDYLKEYQPEDRNKLQFYQDTSVSLRSLHSIDHTLKKALQERVWLNSGAYLVIEHTEAMTVIDVNTGKAIAGRSNPQDIYQKINWEAAREISFQLRLRDISGMILIDFIDMKNKKLSKELLFYMSELVRKDTTKTAVVDMTGLGLMELTRKRVNRPLHEYFE